METIPQKTCTKCGEDKPATLEFFYKLRSGLTPACKKCLSAASKIYRLNNKDDQRDRYKKWIEANRELKMKSRKLWNDRNKERNYLSRKKWAQVNKDSLATYNRAFHLANPNYRDSYREANSEQIRHYFKAYRIANKEKRSQDSRKRRAMKVTNQSESYTTQEILDYYGTDCHICKKPVNLTAPRSNGKPGWELGLHLDHVIPISKGGSDLINNIRPSHGKCNLRKSDKVA